MKIINSFDLDGLCILIRRLYGVEVLNEVIKYVEDKKYDINLYNLVGIADAIREDIFYNEYKSRN